MLRSLLYTFLLLSSAQLLFAQKDSDCQHPDAERANAAYQEAKTMMRNPNQMSMALDRMQEAKEIFRSVECWDQAVKMSYNLTVMYMQRKDMTAMEREMRYAERTSLRYLADTSHWHAKVLSFMGQYYMRKMALDSAKMYLLQAKYIFKHNKEWKAFVNSCRILAQVSYYQQDYRLMERYIDQAFDATKKHLDGDKKMLRGILQLYGVLYYRTGDYESALERTKEGLEIALKSMETRLDTTQVASYYNNIGLFYIEIGDVDKAEDYCKSALSLSLQLKEWYKAGTIYLNLAEFFVKKEQFGKAFRNFSLAFETLKKVDRNDVTRGDFDRSVIQVNIGLARSGYKIGRKQEAFEALDRNIPLHRKERYQLEMTYKNYGELYRREKDYASAARYLNQALSVATKVYSDGKHPDLADIYFEFAELAYDQKKWSEAIAYIDKATEALSIEISGTSADKDMAIVSDKDVLIKLLTRKTQIYIEQGQLKAAYQNSLNAANLTDELRNAFKSEGSKLFILQKVIPIYEQTIDLAIQLFESETDMDYLRKAFELVEKSKAMLLLDALRAEDARNFGGIPNELLREEKRLARELAKKQKLLLETRKSDQKAIDELQQEILSLKRATLNLQDTLEEKYYRYYKLKYEDKTPSLAEVQKHLKRGSLLLEFFIGKDQIYWFAIDQERARVFRAAHDKDFIKMVKAFRMALTNNKWLMEETKLKEVYQLLTEKGYALFQQFIEQSISFKINNLIVIPDGLLNYIPFEVLMTKKVAEIPETPDFRNLPYLIRSYSVFYHYSASLMLFERSKTKSNGKVLAFAPTFKYNDEVRSQDARQHRIRSSVDELPGAKSEVEALSQRFRGMFLYNQDANEARFKNLLNAREHYSVVHLAMHGWVDETFPEYSNLVFSYIGNNEEDNLLYAYELNLLNLEADLVVLSACETGFGKYERGEGVVSLGRGFMYAGVPSLLMTLWPINDQASAVLITEFYDQLAQGKPKHIAMQQAKLNYLENANYLSAHPFFWASYINVGDESSIRLKKQGSISTWLFWGFLTLGLIGITGFFAGRIRRSILIKKSEDQHLHHHG